MQIKKIIVISLAVVILMFISIVIVNFNSESSFAKEVNGIKYAMKLDGNSISDIPSKGLYQVNVECENAECYWDYAAWKLKIKNVKGDVSCDIDFVSVTKNNLNDYVIGLTGTTQGNGQVVSENGYRYEGKNPNNYIWFNNELWRIIGVFDSKSHGQNDTNLVKIIRADSIGVLAWDKGNINNWVDSTLNSLLNGAYLNALDGTDSDYCYISSSVQTNCDYRINGIQDEYRDMIQNVTWYLGGITTTGVRAYLSYAYERGTKVYSGRATSTTGYIGLMYPSDYGYSMLSSSCSRMTELCSCSNLSCAGSSWIVGNGEEWMLTPMSEESDDVSFIVDVANLNRNSASIGHNVRPVLYLKSDVYYIDGDGSILDPIIIGE